MPEATTEIERGAKDLEVAYRLFDRQGSLPGHEHLFLVTYRGSVSQGIHAGRDFDDVDLLGGYAERWSHYVGFPKTKRKLSVDTQEGEYDFAVHELRKLVGLLTGANPNVWPLLWCEEKHVLTRTAIGHRLRAHREMFLSQKVYHTFRGIAHSQMERMEKSMREGEVAYRGYMGAKRKARVREVGYDPKNACHLIRYMRMAVETLSTGEVHIDRAGIDADELLEIKQGRWSADEVFAEADRLRGQVDEAKAVSTLPEKPDREQIEQLLMRLVEEFHLGYAVS